MTKQIEEIFAQLQANKNSKNKKSKDYQELCNSIKSQILAEIARLKNTDEYKRNTYSRRKKLVPGQHDLVDKKINALHVKLNQLRMPSQSQFIHLETLPPLKIN